MPVKPIKPGDVTVDQAGIPDGVIEVFNELIQKNWDGRESRIKQRDAIKAICAKMSCKSDEVIKNHWLDVENVYSNSGWLLVIHNPAWNESGFEPYFAFKKKALRSGR